MSKFKHNVLAVYTEYLWRHFDYLLRKHAGINHSCRQNQHNPYQLLANDSNSITLAPFVKNSPVKLLIHGYTGNRNRSPNKELRSAYFKCCDYNIISVDYNPLASGRCYIQGAHNAKLVGMCIAQLVDELVQNHGFNLSLIHPIGFSLGGQIAGFIGTYLKSGRLYRITGLDPAVPMFWTFDNSKRLDAGDARFVDILHTNSFIRGKFESTGTIDFFANNGMIQPGCSSTKTAENLIKFIQDIADFNTQSSCSHARAVAYYAESINSKVGFHAMKCTTWIGYMVGLCGLLHSSGQDVLFGEQVPLNIGRATDVNTMLWTLFIIYLFQCSWTLLLFDKLKTTVRSWLVYPVTNNKHALC